MTEEGSTHTRRSIEELIDPKFAAEMRRIELRTKRALDSDLMGKYRSAFRGTGLIFSDLREYQPGDEVKDIHWKVTARTNRAYVKTYDEDRQLNVLLVVDVSRSTDYGAPKSKHDRTLEFAALISLLAKKSQDCIGLCLFSNQVQEYFPPKNRRSQFQQIIFSLLRHRELHAGTDLKGALKHILMHQRRSSVVFVVSDFFAEPFDDELRALASKHDVICVLVDDSLDSKIPNAGIVEFEDAEQGGRCLIDTSSARGRHRLEAFHKERVQRLRDLCSSVRADFLRLEDNPLRPLAQLMDLRTSRF